METRGTPAHLGGLPPRALSPRRDGPLVLPAWRSGSGPPGAFLPGAVLGKPASDVHSEFDFFRGLLLPICSINFHYSAFQAVDTETVSSLVHTGSPAATPIRASANAGFPPP